MNADIMTLIGEATAYDKKQQLEVKRPKSWLKSVSAFANGEGGTLAFGISDDDQVIGLADVEGDAERISEELCSKQLVKTEDIHPPKTGISVHFCVLSLMAMQK